MEQLKYCLEYRVYTYFHQTKLYDLTLPKEFSM